MSLINQMLRDLDARRALAGEQSPLHGAVHVVPKPSMRGWLPVVPVLALIVVAVAVGYWLAGATRSAPPPLAPAPAPVPVPAPMPVEPPPRSIAVPPVAAPAQLATPPAPKPRIAAAQPAMPAAAAPVPTPGKIAPHSASGKVIPLAADKSAGSGSAKPVGSDARATAAHAPAASAIEGSIEKRPRGALSNEAAENEYNKAVAALRRGADTEATAALQAALRFDSAHISARQALMSLLVSQKQLAEAQAVVAEGLKIDPAQTGWAIVLARLQMENGKLAEATETLARHAKYADQNADYQAFSAVLMQKQKRYREAGERYRAALALRPAEARWWYGLGVAQEAEGKPQEARAAFMRARETGNLPPELASAVERRLH